MNSYRVSIDPKPIAGSGIGHAIGCGRQITIVTGTVQDALSIARGKINSNEEITGVYAESYDVIIDHSQVQGQQS